ncbi:MAG: hypothetical protein OSA98_09330 [Rubripirellula sp.]|nr:hypothetical protein [Rubripirellula sp.]
MKENPYQTTHNTEQGHFNTGSISATPIVYMKRGYSLIEEQYALVWAITFVGLIIGSVAPLNLLLGPMLVGIIICFIEREEGQTVQFATLFKGMNQFVDCLLVTLAMLLLNLVLTVCVIVLAMLAMVLMLSLSSMQNQQPEFSPAWMGVGFAVFFLFILASMCLFLPFLFSFHLIADRKFPAKLAVTTSASAVLRNFWPLLAILISFYFFSILAAMLCFIPWILLVPIQFAALFTIYRDLFPKLDAPHIPSAPAQTGT